MMLIIFNQNKQLNCVRINTANSLLVSGFRPLVFVNQNVLNFLHFRNSALQNYFIIYDQTRCMSNSVFVDLSIINNFFHFCFDFQGFHSTFRSLKQGSRFCRIFMEYFNFHSVLRKLSYL